MKRLLSAALLLTTVAACAAPAPRRLDSHLERASAWKADRADRVSAVVVDLPGPRVQRALLLDWAKDLGTVENGVPTAAQVPSIWIRLPDDVDLARSTALRFRARVEGPRHGFLHVVVSNKAAMWGEGVKAFIGNVPLDAGSWQPCELALDLAPSHERREMKWLGFASINVGHLPDEPARTRTYIDEVVLTADPLPKRRGWELEPKQLIVSRLGFRPSHEKLGLAHPSRAGRRFEVRPAEGDSVVHAGTFELVASAVGRHAVADFSDLSAPGSYRLHAGGLRSLPFSVGEDATRHSLELLSDWVHGMRCGQETALHPACHLDDGLWLRPAGQTSGPKRLLLPVSGGWHDAGDVRTYYSYSYEMAFRMLRARDAGWTRDRDGDGVDDLRDAARWALGHAPRLVDPVTGGLLDKIDDQTDYRRGNYWTDNRPGSGDERPVRVAPELSRHVASLAASAGLAARRAQTEQDRRIAARAVQLAEARLAEWIEAPNPKRPAQALRLKLDDRHGHELARFGLGALQLFLATEKEQHLELALSCANQVLGLQGESFLPGALQPLGGDIFPWVMPVEDMDLPELFLAELLLELPEHEDAPRWRLALRRVADWWMKPTRQAWGPFSLPSLLVPDKEVPEGAVAVQVSEPIGKLGARWLMPSAGRQQLADTALAMQRVAQALEDPELERLARRQVHWAFGHNPLGLSWVALHDENAIEQMYSFSLGRMAGAVAGYGIGKDGIPAGFRSSGAEPVTHAAAELLAAVLAVTEPSRWSIVLSEGGAPWTGEVTISSERDGRLVTRERADASGRLPELRLDGGERYLLRAGATTVPLVALSGRAQERRIDLGRRLALTASASETTYQSRRFTVELRAENTGTRRLATTVRIEAAGVFPKQREWEIELEPGESATIDWPLHAKSAGRPWLLLFAADQGDARAELGGAVVEPEPPPSAR